jgi:hypothetical protein
VPIEQIHIYPEDHCRVTPLEDTTEEYRVILKEHGHMDPVDIFRESENGSKSFRLAHGYTRMEAYKREGRTEIPAFIHDGTRSDAIKMDITKTCHIGSRATNADKRKAAMLAVTDPILGERTDQEIARQIGVSTSLVASCRKGETTKEATEKKKSKAAKKAASTPASEKSNVGRGGGAALHPVVTRERKSADVSPTKAQLLKQIEEWVDRDQLDEADVIKLFESPTGKYRFVPKDGQETTLQVVGKSGREQFSAPVVVKDMRLDLVVLRYEGIGKFELVGK